MEKLVKNTRLSMTIRILMVLFILASVTILAVKLRGIASLDKAYKASEGVFKEEAPVPTEKNLGSRDALVWLAAGGRAVMLEDDFRAVLYDCSNPFNTPELSLSQIERSEKLFAVNEPAMMLLHRAEGLEAGANPHVWDGTGGIYALYTTRLLALESRVATAKDDYGKFLSSAKLLKVWAEALQGKPWPQEIDDSSIALGLLAEGLLAGIVKEALETPGFSVNFRAEAEALVPSSDPFKAWRDSLRQVVRRYEEGDREWMEAYEGGGFSDDSFIARMNRYLFMNFKKADFINFSANLVADSRKPFDGLPKEGKKEREWNWQYNFLGRIKCTLTQRQLMSASLKAVKAMNETGSWPGPAVLGLNENPWTSTRFACSTAPDGALTISGSGLQELYRSCTRQSPLKMAEKWELKVEKAKK